MAALWNARENVWVVSGVSGLIDSRDLCVKEIRWVGQTAGNTCEIKDPDGNSLWKSVASANNAGDIHDSAKRRWRTGFSIATLDSGTLYIYCE